MAEQFCWIRNRLALFAVLLAFASCRQANAAVMKAGVAKVDITPPPGVQMWGYFDRLKGAEGTSVRFMPGCWFSQPGTGVWLTLTSTWAGRLGQHLLIEYDKSRNKRAASII